MNGFSILVTNTGGGLCLLPPVAHWLGWNGYNGRRLGPMDGVGGSIVTEPALGKPPDVIGYLGYGVHGWNVVRGRQGTVDGEAGGWNVHSGGAVLVDDGSDGLDG